MTRIAATSFPSTERKSLATLTKLSHYERMSHVCRPLTEGERALARSVFGPSIDPEPVRLHRRRWWPLQPKNIIMAPDGHIWFHPGNESWCDDFSATSLPLQGLFLHELTHVWQTQRGIYLPLRRHPFCRYHYCIKPGWKLERYGIEQQAEIVRHAFLLREGYPVPGAPALEQYLGILPFSFSTSAMKALIV